MLVSKLGATLVTLASITLAGVTLASAMARAVPAPMLTEVAPPRMSTPARQVLSESWWVDCHALVARGACDVTLTMELAGGAGQELELDREADVTFDGDALTLDDATNADGASVRRLRLPDVADSSHTLVAVYALAIRAEPRREFLIFPADETRHLLLHDGRSEASYALEVHGSPPPARADGYTFLVEVQSDPTLTWAPPAFASPSWRADGDRWRFTSTPASPTDVSRFLSWSDPGEAVHWGGLMLGLGGGGSGDRSWFVARLEYEVAIVDFILPGLSLDLTTHGLLLAPRIEISTPQIAILPALFAGVGLPIRMQPDPDVGVRLLFGLQFGPVGAAFSFDLRSHEGGLDSEFTGLLRLSL